MVPLSLRDILSAFGLISSHIPTLPQVRIRWLTNALPSTIFSYVPCLPARLPVAADDSPIRSNSKIVHKSRVISALNDAIASCKDREDCFLFCLERFHEDRSDLQSLLTQGRLRCAMAASELQSLVRAHGGEPETSVSLGGALHRNWLDIKAALTGFNRDAILDECDAAAEASGRAFRRAMEYSMSPQTRLVLERQYQAVLRDRAAISALRGEVVTRSN